MVLLLLLLLLLLLMMQLLLLLLMMKLVALAWRSVAVHVARLVVIASQSWRRHPSSAWRWRGNVCRRRWSGWWDTSDSMGNAKEIKIHLIWWWDSNRESLFAKATDVSTGITTSQLRSSSFSAKRVTDLSEADSILVYLLHTEAELFGESITV